MEVFRWLQAPCDPKIIEPQFLCDQLCLERFNSGADTTVVGGIENICPQDSQRTMS